MKALVYENKVVDVAKEEFPVSAELTWMDCPDDCVAGEWIFKDKNLVAPSVPELTYEEKRKTEYPSIEELVVALYDTDDKSAIEAKRAEVKKKYPKP